MKKRLLDGGKLFALSCIYMSVANAAFAADEEIMELPSVTISASRSQSKIEEMPLHTTVISQQDIQKSSAQTVDQLLRNVPGMNFTGVPTTLSDPTGHSTKMRGLTNGKVLVLLDGIPVMDPFYQTTQFFKVPLSGIDRIEVMRGGSTSLWGSMAVAGVVNIISKRAKDNSGEASVGVGSFSTNNEAVSKNFMVSDALSFNVTANRYETGGYHTLPEQYLFQYPGKNPATARNTNLQLATYFKPSADLNGFLRLGAHIQDQNLGLLYNKNLQKSPDLSAGLTKTLDNSSDLSANFWTQSVSFEKLNGVSCYVIGTACTSASLTALTPATVATATSVKQYYSQRGSLRYGEVGGSAMYSKKMEGRWSNFQVGVDYRKISAKDDEYMYGAPTSTAASVLYANLYGEGTQVTEGVFAQTKLYPLDSLELTFAGRYDNWSYKDGLARMTKGATTSGGATSGKTKSSFNPSLGARYELNNEVSLRGAAYKTFRAPGMNNMVRSYGSSTSMTIASPDLNPETMTGWEMGADYRDGGISFGATYFLYSIKNMIATYKVNPTGWTAASIPVAVTNICGPVVPGPANSLANCGGAKPVGVAGNISYYTNGQDGQSHGLELVGDWKIKDNVTLNASYTRTETYLTSSTVTAPLGIQLAGVPKDVAALGVAWRPAESLRTHVELRYIGAMYYDNTTNTTGPWYSQGGNTIYNVSAVYAWDKTIDLSASVVNLFDRQYSENTYQNTQPYSATLSNPRMVNVGLKVRF